MRELLAMLFIIFLVAFGWKQSFSEHLDSILNLRTGPISSPTAAKPISLPPASAPGARPAAQAQTLPPTQASPWMWKKTTMDEPYKQKAPNGR